MHVLLEKEEEKAVVDQVTYKFPVHNEAKQNLSGKFGCSVLSGPVRTGNSYAQSGRALGQTHYEILLKVSYI